MSDDNVIPIGRRRRKQPPAAPDRRVHPSTSRAPAAARDLAAAQNEATRDRYEVAARQQHDERLLATGTPIPARITLALGSLSGPQVDRDVGTFEGNPAGDVDAWEDPDDPRLPDGEQVRLLAKLTGYPISSFYKPHEPRPMRVWISWGGRRGCELVDDDGVPKPPGKEPGQHTLPGMPAAEARPPSRTRQPKKKSGETVRQPTLTGRMPDALRTELADRLTEAQQKHRR